MIWRVIVICLGLYINEEWKKLEGEVDSQYGYPDPEWDLIDQFRGFDAGDNLRSVAGWGSSGTNSSGYTALPAGARNLAGVFINPDQAFLWTSTEYNVNDALRRRLDDAYSGVGRVHLDKDYGESVRCIKGIPFVCGDELIDSRDNQVYNTVEIGEQCWMKENINIGTQINSQENQADNGLIEKYCYNNEAAICDENGGLYQWDEMMEYSATHSVQGICRTGWHLPSDEEWCTLTQFIDPTVDCNATDWNGTDVGIKMKSTSGWSSPGNGTDIFGFTALPGGFMVNNIFFAQGDNAYFWSSTGLGNIAWWRVLAYHNDGIHRSKQDKIYGNSIRCLQD
jgi:uncharacterized protein (TIGR02145 family)